MRVWRLVKTKYAGAAFDGDGARMHGGRWNSVGIAAVYGADSEALAVLEVLVHLRDVRPLPAYSIVVADIPRAFIRDLDVSILPTDWNAYPVAPQVQAIGDTWLKARRGLALRVPSAVVREGFNVLINPGHAAFRRVVVEKPRPFTFDSRLLNS